MFDRLKSTLRGLAPRSLSDIEAAYLAESVSRYDLERRQREVEAGLFRTPARYY
jgi:hypothetical protein